MKKPHTHTIESQIPKFFQVDLLDLSTINHKKTTYCVLFYCLFQPSWYEKFTVKVYTSFLSSCCIGRLSPLPFSKYFVFFTPHRHTLKSPQNNIINQKVKTCTLKEDILTRDIPASAPQFLGDLYSVSREGRSSPHRRRL